MSHPVCQYCHYCLSEMDLTDSRPYNLIVVDWEQFLLNAQMRPDWVPGSLRRAHFLAVRRGPNLVAVSPQY